MYKCVCAWVWAYECVYYTHSPHNTTIYCLYTVYIILQLLECA